MDPTSESWGGQLNEIQASYNSSYEALTAAWKK